MLCPSKAFREPVDNRIMKNLNFSRLVECCENRTNRQFQYCSDYAELGYHTPEKGIVFGNWNPTCGFSVTKSEQARNPVSKLSRVLEANGFELEWADEWDICCDCGKAVRTSADCYSWAPYFRILNECELVCLDCIDREAYLESIEDDCNAACPPQWNPEEHGYTKYNGDFETGWHPGQNDKPKDILAKMHELGMSRVVFKIASVGQFDCTWQAYFRNEENS